MNIWDCELKHFWTTYTIKNYNDEIERTLSTNLDTQHSVKIIASQLSEVENGLTFGKSESSYRWKFIIGSVVLTQCANRKQMKGTISHIWMKIIKSYSWLRTTNIGHRQHICPSNTTRSFWWQDKTHGIHTQLVNKTHGIHTQLVNNSTWNFKYWVAWIRILCHFMIFYIYNCRF